MGFFEFLLALSFWQWLGVLSLASIIGFYTSELIVGLAKAMRGPK